MRLALASLAVLCLQCSFAAATAFGADPQTAAAEGPAALTPLSPADTKAVRELLDKGFARNGYRAAEPLLKSLAQRDPRIDYARGLVLLENLKAREAIAAFESAVQSEGAAYFPAWEALIRTRLAMKSHKEALEAAAEMGKRLQKQTSFGKASEVQLAAASWLGRFVESCALAEIEPAGAPSPWDLDTTFRRNFDPALLAAYEKGIVELTADHQAQVEALEASRTAAKQRAEDRAAERAARIQENKEKAKQRAKNVQMTAQEWNAWLDEQMKNSNAELERLQKDYEALDAAAKKLTEMSLQSQRRITLLRLNRGRSDARGDDIIAIDRTILELDGDIAKYQVQFTELAVRADAVVREANAVAKQRLEAIKQYETATGQLAKKDADLKKWNAVLQKSAEKNRHKAGAAGDETSQDKILTRATTYLELDPEIERDRLLDEINGAP